MAGAVLGVLVFVMLAIVTVVVLLYFMRKWDKKRKLRNMQLDIFAM